MHLATLHAFLSACGQLHPAVNVKNVITALIDRLALFAQRQDSGGIPGDIQLFDIFSAEIANVIKGRGDRMPPEDIVSLQVSLVNMAHSCYPGRDDYVDTVLEVTKSLFDNVGLERAEHGTPVGRELERLLKIPVEALNDMIAVLALKNFRPLLDTFDFEGRRAMARFLAENVVDNDTAVDTPERVEEVLAVCAPLLCDQEDGPPADKWDDPEEFAEEQGLVGRLVHQLRSEDPDVHFLILSATRKRLGAGGPRRIAHTLPPVVMQAFKLAKKFHAVKDKVHRRTFLSIFQ